MNEPGGLCSRVVKVGKEGSMFIGLYVADTGNNCVRFVKNDGMVETYELYNIPPAIKNNTCNDE